MREYVLKFEERDKEALGAIRCIDRLKAAVDNGYIWVKGINEASLDNRIKQLPVKNTFIVDENNNLFIPGGLTPVDMLRSMEWIALTEFIIVEAPVSAMPGVTNEKISIQIVASAKERKGTALLTSLADWKEYAETAPDSRLSAVKFAVSENNEVLITGNPLPPLPGKEYWEIENIFIPCGYDFQINMLPSFISRKWNENKTAIILFDTEGKWQRIEKSYFVQGKRSAVRLTELRND